MDAASEMKLQIFSNQYYEFVDRFVQSDFENSKVLGKFYTDITIAKRMMSDLLQNYVFPENKDMIRIIDPFCGDGRLIKILLLQLIEIDRYDSTPLDVVLWDVDGEVVKKAKQGIEKLADEIGLRCTVTTRNADAYVLYSSEKSQFDICVTNPPWGLLKPQKVFNERCSQEEVNEYKNSIALYDDYMKTEFPLSQPTKKFGKWGTNLGRIGTEVALRLISNDGICGLVSPASLFNDQVSVPLREWLFDKHKIYSIFYYPAELKLYGSADVSSVTTVIGKGQTDTSLLTKMYNVDGSYQIRQLTDFQLDFVRRNQYALPLESGFDAFEILCHLGELPSVIECCDSAGFHFVRELDETRVSEKLKSKGEIIFAKGYMVDRYSFLEDGLFLDDEKVTPPETVMGWKLVWRDVSRNSQKRRMKATILPPGYIAGNSLGVISNMDESKNKLLFLLLAIMNSMIFEFQARGQLVSNHVSSGVIKQLRIPRLAENEEILTKVDNQMAGQNEEWNIEVLIAKMYGLTKEQFMSVACRYNLSENESAQLQKAINRYY